MRVLFAVSSWPTHYFSMVPLGWALQAAGHDLRVLCAPSQQTPVGQAGLTPVPILDGMEMAVHNRLQYFRQARAGDWPYPWLPLHPLTGEQMASMADFDLDRYAAREERVFADRARQSADAAVRYARDWRPDLVVHDPVSLDGPLAARAAGVPAVMSLWGPVGTAEPGHLRTIPDDIASSFARHGFADRGPEQVDHVLDPCPDSLAPPTEAKRLPIRYLPYNGAGPTPPGPLGPGPRPRVCVAWSTALTAMSGPQTYLLPELVDRLAALDAEVVVTATEQDAAALGRVPASVRVLVRCPLRLLLPGCAAVVHHGGAGSTMTALWAGVPQLGLTFAAEQAANAERVAAAGAGLHLPGHLAAGPAAAEAVAALLADGRYRRRAAELAGELERRPSPAELVDTLCGLAGR